MRILLVHGLGRTPLSLFSLANHLRHHGHQTRFFAYSSTIESLPGIISRLIGQLRQLAANQQPVSLIGHSLGGILLRRALAEVPQISVHHLVLLGSPMRSPRMASHAWKWRLFRALTRDCGRFLATPEEFSKLPPLAVPYSLIVGTSGPRGKWSPFGRDENDGLVSVSETLIDDQADVFRFPVWHSFMMNHRGVQERITRLCEEK